MNQRPTMPLAIALHYDKGKTEAKPEIWTKSTEFDTKMKDFQQEAAKLAEVAKGGDEKAIKAQFGKTAETCKACHKEFRKE